MLYKFAVVLFFCCLSIDVNAQNAHITFVSEQNNTIDIYEPIDGGYNDLIPQKRINIAAHQSIVYEPTIDDTWSMIHCQFSAGGDCELLVFPGDTIMVYINNGQVIFRGGNSAGLQLFYDNFTSVGHRMKFLGTMDAVFNEYVEMKRGIQTVVQDINKLVIFPQLHLIDNLNTNSYASKEFIDLIKKNAKMLLNGYVAERLTTLLTSKHFRTSSIRDSIAIMHKIDSIFRILPVENRDLIKFNYNTLYIPQYLSFYHKNEVPKLMNYDIRIFGPYRNFLFAPTSTQLPLLGSACLIQYKYDSKEMDMPNVVKFFLEKFANSEYTSILMEKSNAFVDSSSINKVPYFIKEDINSLSQLGTIDVLKGKFLYVDLWASWCLPCRVEFKHREQVDNILSLFPNIAVVYISIDDNKDKESWKDCIEYYKLNGFHLRASKVFA